METPNDLIKTNLLIHGHSLNIEPLLIEPPLINLAYTLATTEFKNENLTISPLRHKEVLQKARDYLENKLRLHDVGYCSDEMIKAIGNKRVSSIEEVIDIYNGTAQMMSPFKIPVKFNQEDSFAGILNMQASLCDDETFLKLMNIYFKYIALSKRTSTLTPSCYLHEIMHTQLESQKGIVKDYYNSEVLSILIELIYAYESYSTEDTLKILEMHRINYLLYEFDRLFKFQYENDGTIDAFTITMSSKYIVSILKALQLFISYYNGSKAYQAEMIKQIQRVIDGQIQLEEMLAHYEVTFANSVNDNVVQHLLRKQRTN